MAGELWLALAAACIACAVWRGCRYLRRPAYTPRHTAEQRAVEHEGVTDTSPLLRDLPLAPPPPPIDPRILLIEAKAERARIDRRIAELEALVQQQEERRLHVALDALQTRLVDRLRRAGNADIHTAELSRADIRRIVRSGASR